MGGFNGAPCVVALVVVLVAGLAAAVLGAVYTALENAPLTRVPGARIIRVVGGRARKLMVVAHADDECIFGGEHILADPPGTWKVIVLTAFGRPDFWHRRSVDERMGGAARAAQGLRLAELEAWGYGDSSQSARWPDRAAIVDALQAEIHRGGFELVATHGPFGDYGHIQHAAVHRLVVEAASTTTTTTPVFVFDQASGFCAHDLSAAALDVALDAYAAEDDIVRRHMSTRWGLVPLRP